MIKHLGRSGIAELVEKNCHAAAEIARMLEARNGIRVLNTVQLNQVIVQFGEGLAPEAVDLMTQDVIALLQREGQVFVGGAQWRGRQVMRISVSNYQTDEDQAEIAAEAILAAYARVSSGMA
jgi:glutamate/tyrosine decarboxylase-like PLP-dependent enzyme